MFFIFLYGISTACTGLQGTSSPQAVLLQLSLLQFLTQHFGTIVSYCYRGISSACITIYLPGTFAMQARSIHHQSTQVSAGLRAVHTTYGAMQVPMRHRTTQFLR